MSDLMTKLARMINLVKEIEEENAAVDAALHRIEEKKNLVRVIGRSVNLGARAIEEMLPASPKRLPRAGDSPADRPSAEPPAGPEAESRPEGEAAIDDAQTGQQEAA